jgi:hypothetical protein
MSRAGLRCDFRERLGVRLMIYHQWRVAERGSVSLLLLLE